VSENGRSIVKPLIWLKGRNRLQVEDGIEQYVIHEFPQALQSYWDLIEGDSDELNRSLAVAAE
jgi:hypothetical protein